MPTLDALDPVEREWLVLARKLRLARGFVFIVYFSADERITLALKARLREDLIAHTATLNEIRCDSSESLTIEVLEKIFADADLPMHREEHARRFGSMRTQRLMIQPGTARDVNY